LEQTDIKIIHQSHLKGVLYCLVKCSSRTRVMTNVGFVTQG